MKRRRAVVVERSVVDWNNIPDDVIEAVMTVMVRPLVEDERPSVVIEEAVYAYFQCLSTCSQFYRVGRRMDFDWLRLLEPYDKQSSIGKIKTHMLKLTKKLEEPEKSALARTRLPLLTDEPKRMIRALLLYDSRLSVSASEIDAFMLEHQIVSSIKKEGKRQHRTHNTKKSGLKTKPLAEHLSVQFNVLLTLRVSLGEKRLALLMAIHSYAQSLVKQKVYNYHNEWLFNGSSGR